MCLIRRLYGPFSENDLNNSITVCCEIMFNYNKSFNPQGREFLCDFKFIKWKKGNNIILIR